MLPQTPIQFPARFFTDKDAVEIFASLTGLSSSQTDPAIVELESEWSGTWNEDLDIFSVKSTNEVKLKFFLVKL